MNPIKRYTTRRTTPTLALALAVLAMASMPAPAAAYIGPGAALSLLGAFWGLLVAVAAAVAFAVAWPIRRMLRLRRERSRLEQHGSPGRGQDALTAEHGQAARSASEHRLASEHRQDSRAAQGSAG